MFWLLVRTHEAIPIDTVDLLSYLYVSPINWRYFLTATIIKIKD